jgi:hypothetical protein
MGRLMLKFTCVLLALLPKPSFAATWLCHAANGVGYSWNKVAQAYQPQIFSSDDRYVLRPFKDTDVDPQYEYQDKPPEYVAVELGDDEIVAFFYYDLEQGNGTNSLVGRYQMQFFSKTNELVIQSIFYGMQMPTEDRGVATPYFAIAKCSEI